jgi:two-component system phosphate regulon sensor histidine kinase PhoR
VLRKFYWEVVRKQQFDELIKQVKQEQKNKSAEIAFGSRIFLCDAVYIVSRDEVVVSFYDITRMKMIEAIKKDFVENVSHELNTPLAAIKGYVETLAEEIGPDHHKYLDIIRRHTDRLINIVKDLLTLSELEGEETKPMVEKLNLVDVVKDILKIFNEPIKAKHLRLESEFTDEPLFIEGDRFKLEQLFINLIDNAVKYTEKGKVAIRIQKTEAGISVQVQDTGIGISEEHLPRIFERFYVIDKSRSRQVGGTGLGLSIAKHIAGIHRARIEVQSRPSEGTTFTVLFPSQPN